MLLGVTVGTHNLMQFTQFWWTTKRSTNLFSIQIFNM